MQKFSTLIYCISHIHSNVDFIDCSVLEKEADYLETEEVGPSEESIKNILNFARSYDVLETESAGYVEMILN